MLRCRSPRAPGPPLPGGASSPAPLPASDRQGPGGKQWAAGGGGNMEDDDVGDEVASARGSRVKLSSFSCSHRFPSRGGAWGEEKRHHWRAAEQPDSHTSFSGASESRTGMRLIGEAPGTCSGTPRNH